MYVDGTIISSLDGTLFFYGVSAIVAFMTMKTYVWVSSKFLCGEINISPPESDLEWVSLNEGRDIHIRVPHSHFELLPSDLGTMWQYDSGPN